MDPLENASIDYPCEWEYRIIGVSFVELRDAVTEVVAGEPYTLTEANRKGRYVSMSLVMNVRDEAQRDRIFRALVGHQAIHHVL